MICCLPLPKSCSYDMNHVMMIFFYFCHCFSLQNVRKTPVSFHTKRALVVAKRVLRKRVLIRAAWKTLPRRSIFTFIFRLLPSSIRPAHQQTSDRWHGEGREQQLYWPCESRNSDMKQSFHFWSHSNNRGNMVAFLYLPISQFFSH